MRSNKINNVDLFTSTANDKFNKHIRADLDFRYAGLTYKAEAARQKLHITAFFLNGYYDIITWRDSLTPYLTVGMGVGNNKPGDLTEKGEIVAKGHSKQNFVWNIGGGMKYSFNKNYAVDLEYKYIDLGKLHNKTNVDMEFITVANQKVRGNQVMVHLSYIFQ